MFKRLTLFLCLVASFSFWSAFTCNSSENPELSFGAIAKQESANPIKPGKPGVTPFWNGHAQRFIYAPAFDFKTIKNADSYRYKILCTSDSSTYTFDNKVPYAPLSPIWSEMPVGYFKLKVIGVSGKGDSLGLAGKGKYYRAAYFNGPYHKALMPYDSSGILALSKIMHKSYVNYWLSHKEPDPSYNLYRYPAKTYSALISGAVTYARNIKDKAEAERAIKIAKIVADNLIDISFPKGYQWAYCPPTYYGDWITKGITKGNLPSYMEVKNIMPRYCEWAGRAYLDLYDYTGEKKYLQSAIRIAKAYIKNQLGDGTWYKFVNAKTGEPTAKIGNITIPVHILNYLKRISKETDMKGVNTTRKKAFKWIMENPVKTFNWDTQFEDVGTHKPYTDLCFSESSGFAIYLLKNKKHDSAYIKLALELIRFSEDQFVIWEKPRLLHEDSKSLISTNWITPCAVEQYWMWLPTPATIRMAKTFSYAYKVTHKKIFLAKAKSLANSAEIVQKFHDGNYSTIFSKSNFGQNWINGMVHTAQKMIDFGHSLNDIK